MSFHDLGLHPDLLRGVQELGFKRPTPIQARAIPPGLEGKDVLACAMTGSGKSAAFLLPILQRLMGKKRGATRALILTPTRELAAQIEAHLHDLAMHTPITGASVFGGVGMGPQEHALRSGVDVIVATPGRLLDHMKHPYVKFGALEVLVLDEADRMLDMGFLPDIKRILGRLPTKRQTLFFSATMPTQIAKLSHEMLKSPVSIDIERRSAPAVGITQAVYPVRQDLKPALLLALLRGGEIDNCLVFTRTKHRANKLALVLERNGVRTDRIHGNRSQAQRTRALESFKAGKFQVLVATDIAARGIDVTELSHVVNFDVPASPDDYIHRVGRTARAERTGDAFTLVAPQEEEDLRAIEKRVGKRLPRITLPGFDYEVAAEKLEKRDSARSQGGRSHAPRSHGGQAARPSRGYAGGSGRKPHARASSRPASHSTSSSSHAASSRSYGAGRSRRPLPPSATTRKVHDTAAPTAREKVFGQGVDGLESGRSGHDRR